MKSLAGRIWGVEDFGEMQEYIEELEDEVQLQKQRYEAERQKNSCLGWTIERLEERP